MSKILFGLALLCLVASVQAANVTVSATFPATADCSGPSFSTVYVAGACANTDEFSSAYFCANSNVYLVAYDGQNCSSSKILSVSELPSTCGILGFGTKVTCSGTDSPVLPFPGTFPPSGYSLITNYKNNTASGAKVAGCATGTNILTYQSAGRQNYCRTRSARSDRTQPSSSAGFCNSDSTRIGEAIFKTADCTGAVAVAELSPAGVCVGAGTESASTTSCGSAPAVIPSDVPAQGAYLYSRADCTDAPGQILRQADCFDSATLTFDNNINGTGLTYGVFQSYTQGGGAAGSCGAVSRRFVAPVDVCTFFMSEDGENTYIKFVQNFSPASAASAVQVSMVAALFAAVVAVVAGRSL